MESCGDCEQSQEAVRVKEEPEHPPSPVDCYLATPTKEDTDNARPADCLVDTQYVKEEALRVDSEDQDASCSETAGCGGSSAAAMLASLYADHTIKDELVLGPEVLHRPNGTPVFRVDCYFPTPMKEETDNARPADCLDETQYVKEEALCVDSEEQEASCSETAGWGGASAAAMLAGLYADHTIKDELELGPEVLHRPNVTPVFRGDGLVAARARPQQPLGGARLASDCSVRLERPPPRPAPPAPRATHAQDIHTRDDKEEELICDLCGEKFGLKCDLLRHAVVHIYTPTSAGRGQAGRGAGHSVDFYLATPIKEETVNARPADCLDETQYVKQEALCVDSEEQEGSCSEAAGWGGASAAAMLAGLYADHTIKDELVLGPEVLHRPNVTPVFHEAVVVAARHAVSEAFGRRCSVRLERVLVDAARRSCRLGRRTYRLRTAPEPAHTASCDHCGEAFPNKSLLIKHLRTHLSLELTRSGYSAREESNVFRHQTLDPRVKPFKCNYCYYKCNHKGSLRRHQMKHTGIKPFNCNYCDYKCSQKVSLRRHLMKHTGIKPFNCNYCDYKCRQKVSLRRHEMNHTGIKPFSCNHCDYKCVQKGDLLRHEMKHTGIQPFKCSHCDYKCYRKGDLLGHEMKHTGTQPFKCSYCDYKCSWKVSLRRHQMKHTGIKPFNCNYCDYKCRQKVSLRRHEMNHTGIKPFSCNHCDYKCVQKGDLFRHEMKHTGIQPFKCSYCDYKCSRKGDLLKHEMKHTGTQPFKCSYCDYKCSRKRDLPRHEMIHTGIKPFNCNYCDYKCNRKENLRKHEMKHTCNELTL